MSIVSSYFSSRSTAFGINAQVASLMDSILAIGVGLGVRFVIDLVSHHDVKLTGTLVGLWEGVVMQHFLRKMPNSFDPYVAYGVRLFIDFLFTESVPRLVLVLVWTGMGVIFADIAPALWIDVGMRRIWRRFRRDLYVMSKSVPSVPLFTRPRTVRFSSSRTASVISTTPPSLFTATTQDPTRLSPPTPGPRKRAVPGAFPGDVSETETDISQRSETSTSPGTAHHRFSSFKRYQATFETGSEISSGFNDLDEGNISSSDSSCSTQTADPSAANPSEIPDYEEEEEIVRVKNKGKGREEEDREVTPRAKEMVLPPTPSDSFAFHHGRDEPDEMLPPVAEVPNIPDQPDDDWENISRGEAVPTPPPGRSTNIPPTPPAKDDLPLPIRTSSPPPQQVSLPTESQPTEQVPPPQSEATVPATTDPSGDLVNLDTEVPLASQQTDLPPSSSQQSGEPPAESTTEPTEKPATSSAHFDDLFNTRSDNRTPPPPFQEIYDQVQQRASLFKPDVETTNPTAQPNPENDTNVPANDTTDQANPSDAEPTNETIVNKQTNPETIDTTGVSATQQQEPEANAPAATEVSAQADVSKPPTVQTPPPPSPAPTVASVLPEPTSERLVQALKLRNQVVELENDIEELKRQRDAAKADGEGGADIVLERTASIDAAEKKLGRLNEKASTRYNTLLATSDGGKHPNKLDASDLPIVELAPKVEQAMTLLLLKNEPNLSITLALKAPMAKRQKAKIALLLEEHELTSRDAAKLVVVTLPTSS